ncbi:14865_t:CDS:2, partial [Acaulospora morrowiae]
NGYSASANTSEYYYGSTSSPATGNSNSSSTNPQQQTAPPSTSSQGYASHPRNEGYEGGGGSSYSSGYNYSNYPAPATSGSYQTGQNSSTGGSANSPAPPYNSNGGTNKTSYGDRGSDYDDGASYSGNKNPYGEDYGGNYKSRDNSREGGYGPPPKDDGAFNNYGNRSEDGSMTQSVDTIYISNLSKEVTEEKLADYFGSLGMLKIDKRTQKPKIWIYYDKATGIPKGDATLTYEDPDSTKAAIKYFDNQPFLGQPIKVEMSVRKISSGFRARGGRGRGRVGFSGRGGSGRGGGGPPPREGDWTCESCHSNNFARRTECYKCSMPRGDATGSEGGFGGRYSGSPRGGYRGRRGGPSSYGSRYNGEDRGYGGSGYRNNDSGYDQNYGRPNKPDDRQERRENSRYRPY